MFLSNLSTRNELADLLGIKRKNLTYILFIKKVNNCYDCFDIPKKNGGVRHIYAPRGELKLIQKKLLRCLSEHLENIRIRNNIKVNISHAFEKNRNIVSNAEVHKNKKIIINLDLKDYFESFHIGRVIGFFEKNKFFKCSHEVAVTIAQLVCFNNHLPQGAPSSPIITNLISQIFDYKILKISKKYHLDYTRYADDLTFSTNEKRFYDQDNLDTFFKEICTTIIKSGFNINHKKTRVVFKDSRQMVTGLVVNKKINVPRDYVKKTRAMFYSFYKNGIYVDEQNIKNDSACLEGRFSFIDSIEHYNNTIDSRNPEKKVKHDFHNLSSKEKEYRNFLFYINFINNDTPLIFTEGKTDVLYIKAALKNLYKFYPKLISLEDGEFVFKVRFFHRSRKMNYFFGISSDGADAMTNFYKNFYNKKNIENLSKYFYDRHAISSKQPVFIVFDNETKKEKNESSKGKPIERPLSKMLNLIENFQKKEIIEDNICLLDEYSNLNLVSIPLPPNKTECEMEDLFSQSTLSVKINGREFSRKDEDKSKFYNKDIFANYVMRHYESIDFSLFKPLLDIVNSRC